MTQGQSGVEQWLLTIVEAGRKRPVSWCCASHVRFQDQSLPHQEKPETHMWPYGAYEPPLSLCVVAKIYLGYMSYC